MRPTLPLMFAVLVLACGDESVVGGRPGPPLIPIVIEDEFAHAVDNLKKLYPLRQRYVKAGRWDLVVEDPDADVDTSINGAIDLFIELMFFTTWAFSSPSTRSACLSRAIAAALNATTNTTDIGAKVIGQAKC